MINLLLDEKYNFVTKEDKDFIIAFDDAIIKVGYQSNGINPYVCLGKYKIEYSKVRIADFILP